MPGAIENSSPRPAQMQEVPGRGRDGLPSAEDSTILQNEPLADVKLENAKLEVILERLGRLRPVNAAEALAQCTEMFEHLSAMHNVERPLVFLLEPGHLIHFNADPVRARAIEILGQKHGNGEEAQMACVREIRFRERRCLAVDAALDVLNRHLCASERVANSVVATFTMLGVLDAEAPSSKGADHDLLLALFEPKLTVAPSESKMLEACNRIREAFGQEGKVSPHVFDMLAAIRSPIVVELLRDLAIGRVDAVTEFSEALPREAFSYLPAKLLRTVAMTGAVCGVGALAGNSALLHLPGLAIVAGGAAAFNFFLAPLLRCWAGSQDVREELHPIVPVRAVGALSKMLPDTEAAHALAAVIADPVAGFNSKRDAAKALCSKESAEEPLVLDTLQALAESPDHEDRLVAAIALGRARTTLGRSLLGRLKEDKVPEVSAAATEVAA